MDKKGLLQQWLDEFDDLASAHAEAFDIGRGFNKEQSDAYWLGIDFGRSFFKDQIIQLLSKV